MCKMVVITDAQSESSCCEIVCVKLGRSGIENKIAKRNGMNIEEGLSVYHRYTVCIVPRSTHKTVVVYRQGIG